LRGRGGNRGSERRPRTSVPLWPRDHFPRATARELQVPVQWDLRRRGEELPHSVKGANANGATEGSATGNVASLSVPLLSVAPFFGRAFRLCPDHPLDRLHSRSRLFSRVPNELSGLLEQAGTERLV